MGARPSSYVTEELMTESGGAVTAMHSWSDEQDRIFEWFVRGTGNLIIEARAGSGKTTTLREGITRAPEDVILAASFDKKSSQVLERTIKDSRVTASTWHSVGYKIITAPANWPKAKYDQQGDRAKKLTALVCPKEVYDNTRKVITGLHTKARESMPHATGPEDLIQLAIANDYIPQQKGVSVEDVCAFAYEAMLKAMEPTLFFDYADMLYLPLRCGMRFPQFDLVVGDEAQDYSEPQLEMMQLCACGRIAVVGDTRQSIYAWRGADAQAMPRMKRELDAAELFLTTTYRCDRTIVQRAQQLVPDITWRANAEAGAVVDLTPEQMLRDVEPGDFILSRTNAPLVRVAMGLLRQKRRCKVEGKDLGATLLHISQRCSKWGDIQDLSLWEKNLSEWASREIRRAEQADVPTRAQLIADQAQTLLVLSDDAQSIDEIHDRIAWLFDDDLDPSEFIICSTVHKAKGQEAARVFVLRDTLFPRVRCTCGHRHFKVCERCGCTEHRPDPAAVREEENIAYVAITRAKHMLAFVSDNRG